MHYFPHPPQRRRVIAALALLALALPAGGCAAPGARGLALTIEIVEERADGGFRFPAPAARWEWVADGKYAARAGNGSEWLDPATLERIPSAPDPLPGSARSLAPLLGVAEDAAQRLLRSAADRSDDGACVLLLHEGDLYLFRAAESQLLRITETAETEYGGDLNPAGTAVAYLRNYNLYVQALDRDERTERALSEDGGERLLYGRLDWVYQEEIYGRGRWDATWWSPDGETLAFLRLDDREVPMHTLVDERPHGQKIEKAAYPQAGDPNPRAELWIASLSGEVRPIDLARLGDELLIVNVAWQAVDGGLYVQVQDRLQSYLALLRVELPAGAPRELLRESSATWVDPPGAPRFLADGTLLWLSERTGHRHLYHYARDGALLRALTAGAWDVFEVLAVDDERGEVWLDGNREHPLERHAYRVRLAGGPLERVTAAPGKHRVAPSGDCGHFLDRHSSIDRPATVDLCDRSGRVRATLEDGLRIEDIPFRWHAPRLVEIPSSTGATLDGLVVLPHEAERGERCPILIETYAGPETASVENEWHSSLWAQFLAQRGVAVLRLNCRTASVYGQANADLCFRQLGAIELRDHEDALRWAAAQPWGDGARAAISGHSYGGFMAAYALTHSKRFRLGIAESGVYDWRHYDSIYTERYMGLPAQNPGGYRRSSCIEAAGNLSGHLLLLHGTLDDNVHPQNTQRFCNALIESGRTNFELMLFPGAGHSYHDSEQLLHRRRLHWSAIRRILLGDRGGAHAE
ncbi:MAG: S9 family peptidase [Planctomycetes bacterium]|nr:S9 family peptidase [Planctomycetota bacterium]